jgi:hypothetical protein
VEPQPGDNPPRFYHYSYPNESHNSLCNLLGAYSGALPDEYGVAPGGWSEWVRDDSLKVFVEITDDNVACQTVHLDRNIYISDDDSPEIGAQVAEQFEQLLFGLQPAVFGDASARNYVFHSIVGLGENTPATAPWQPGDPQVLGLCGTAISFGTGYQALSQRSGGLRFPLCQTASYDAVFQEIAAGVISGAVVDCEFDVPPSPPGQTIDLSTVVVEYTPGDMSTPLKFQQVPAVGACEPGSFYIEGGFIKLCPDVCTIVQADASAKVNILYGCDPRAQ